LRAQIYGLTGLADRTTLAVFSTSDFREQQIYQISHDFRLGSEGFDAGGRLTYAVTRPEIGGIHPALSKTLLATVEAGYGFVRSRKLNLHASAGLDLINQSVDLFGRDFNEDRLRIAFARLDLNAQDGPRAGYSVDEPFWRAAGSIELRKGLSIFDASDRCGTPLCLGVAVPPSRPEGNPRAASVRFFGTFELRPVPAITLAVSERAQYSSQPLFAFEEFSGGNYTVGRGYDPGAIAGDRGFGLQGEIRGGSLVPKSATSLAVQPFAFVDAAWVWNEDRFLAGARKDHLVSVGGGLRAAYGDRARLDLLAAVPTRKLAFQTEKDEVRVMMTLTVRLFPWKRD
jgi:hemolysin activation/secretion protein